MSLSREGVTFSGDEDEEWADDEGCVLLLDDEKKQPSWNVPAVACTKLCPAPIPSCLTTESGESHADAGRRDGDIIRLGTFPTTGSSARPPHPPACPVTSSLHSR